MLRFEPIPSALEPCCPTYCAIEFSDKIQILAKTYGNAEIQTLIYCLRNLKKMAELHRQNEQRRY